MMHSVGEGFCVVDAEWRVLLINETFASMFGKSAEQAVGLTTFELNPDFKNSIFYEGHERALVKREPTVRVGHSKRLGAHLMVRSYPFEDGMAIFIHNLGKELERYQRFVFLAKHDELTSLPNRVALTEEVARLAEDGKRFVLGFIDLDRFKNVNDTQGHSTGDRLLMEIAARFKAVLGIRGSIFRMGGDEFIVLAPCEERAEGERAIRDVIASASERVTLGSYEFTLGATGGAVFAPDDGSDFESLIRRADLAMYEAKQSARGGVAWFEKRLEDAAMNRVELEGAIRRAIATDQFELFYQPKANIRGLACTGAEALIRWRHPQRGFVSPMQFLPIAEETGLMGDIDRWVLERAIGDIANFRKKGLGLKVSINLSALSLCDPQLPDLVSVLLSEYGVPPEAIELEITESTLMQNIEGSKQVLARMEALGISFSVDDFGTGYSSLAYLTRYPVDVLKIDKSFVSSMEEDVSSHKVVKGIIALAHSLDMQVVAEGVETVAQLRSLAEMDCDVVQGYFYGKPMPREEFVLFAAQHAGGTPSAGPESVVVGDSVPNSPMVAV